MKQKQKFRVVRAKIFDERGGHVERWLIVEDDIPIYRINEWIDFKSIRKIKTGKEYACKLVVFLNFLDKTEIEFKNACYDDVLRFLMYMTYGDQNTLIIPLTVGKLSYSTLSKYITVITGFYQWLDKTVGSNMAFETRQNHAKRSYLYGQIYQYEYKTIIDKHILSLNSVREYIKWYTEDEIKAISNNFFTFRDKAIFLITLEGFRIDEVLSMKLDDYDHSKRLINPTRSKGKPDSNTSSFKHRVVFLPKSTCEIIDKYIFTERMNAEIESGKLNQSLFINVKKCTVQGETLKYRSYWGTFKNCAKRAGFDETKIRIHSGRSTKVMKCLEHQALHPEDGITDVIIAEMLGWRNLQSMEHYRDHNNQIIAKSAFDKLHKNEVECNE